MWLQDVHPLYRLFRETYPRRSRKFDHIGLLCEPYTRADIEKHEPVIQALNQFITKAWAIREQMQLYDGIWDSDDEAEPV